MRPSRWMAFAVVCLFYVATLQAAEVRKLGSNDLEWGTGTTTSPAGKVVTKINASIIPIVAGDNALSVNDAVNAGTDLRSHLPAGYVTDGSVDYATEIQAWADNCTAGHKKCIAPAGIFKINSTITISNLNAWVIEGTFSEYYDNATVFKWGGSANGTMFSVEGCRWFEISRLKLDGDNTAGVGLWVQKSATNATDRFTSRNLYTKDIQGSPGVGLYLGQSAAGAGLNTISIYDYESYINREGVRIDGGGGQSIRFFGGTIYCESQAPVVSDTIGINVNNQGFINTYDTQITYCTTHYKMNTLAHTLNIFGGYHEYAAHDTLLNWVNHNGGSVNMIGSVHAGATDNLIVYGGGTVAINSTGNTFDSDNNVLAAAGNQLVKLSSINDVFTVTDAGWQNNTSYDHSLIYGSTGKIKDGPDGTLVWDPGTVADNTGVTSDPISIGSALAFGDTAEVGAPYDLAGVVATAYISNAAAGQVNIRLQNESGASFAPGSGTWKVRVKRAW